MRRSVRSALRTIGATVPAALVGSIAITAVASPAYAVTDAPTETVQPGDTVTAIAARHGLRTVDVLSWNGLGWSSIIRPGDVIRLSAPDAVTPPAPAPPAAAPAAPIAPAPAAPAPAAGSYVVASGDTMSGIAQRHGVSTDAVLAANGLTRASIIYPGQTVTIPAAPAPASPAIVPAAAAAVALDAEQAANAQLIVRVGRGLGVPDRAIAVALATAMQESSLRNLDHGPDDSVGLFQQRPSMGWGADAEIMDPQRATRVFYGGPGDPNGSRTRGLLDIAGWEGLGFADAAQAVQISAYPDRYATWEPSAYVWLATLG